MEYTEVIIDLDTGEKIIRPFTKTEIDERKKIQAELDAEDQAAQIEAETRATARAAILNRLGITAEEAQLLLGGN
jgi:hypothetical protein